MKASPFKHVHRLGIELEGGWDKIMPDVCIGRDGSVHVTANHYGELPSPPLYPFRFEKWLRAHHPTAVNDSCGMHVHVSVRSPLDYNRLMRRKFYNRFLAEAETLGRTLALPESHLFWLRLRGANNYCARRFAPEEQYKAKSKGLADRYTHLNFCWSLHGTMECRLFPAFSDPEHSTAAVRWLLHLVESYLSEFPAEKVHITKIFTPRAGEGTPAPDPEEE
jgi:hypothetical protein